MNLADVFTVLFVILGFLLVFLGYWLLAYGLFPRLVERCAERIGQEPVKSVALGAVTLLPIVFLGMAASNKAPNGGLKVLALVVVFASLIVALLGSAGLALRVGEGLKSSRDAAEPWRRVLRGGVVLGLTFVLPFIGQFVMLPGTLSAGFGAMLFGRRRPKEAPATAAAEASTLTTPA